MESKREQALVGLFVIVASGLLIATVFILSGTFDRGLTPYHSYFKNADGEIHTVSPWRLNEYWAAVREPDWSQFVIRQRK